MGTPQTGNSSVRPWKSTRTAGRVHTAQKHVVWRGGFQNNHEIREARPTAQHMLQFHRRECGRVQAGPRAESTAVAAGHGGRGVGTQKGDTREGDMGEGERGGGDRADPARAGVHTRVHLITPSAIRLVPLS